MTDMPLTNQRSYTSTTIIGLAWRAASRYNLSLQNYNLIRQHYNLIRL